MQKHTIILREDIENHPDYSEMMQTEKHHNHEIVEINNVLRWKENETSRKLVDDIGLNEIWDLFYNIGLDKNSEIIRKLYRDIGYSLHGYWEIFYWEVNNEIADSYNPDLEHSIDNLPDEKKYVITMFIRYLKKAFDLGIITKNQKSDMISNLFL